MTTRVVGSQQPHAPSTKRPKEARPSILVTYAGKKYPIEIWHTSKEGNQELSPKRQEAVKTATIAMLESVKQVFSTDNPITGIKSGILTTKDGKEHRIEPALWKAFEEATGVSSAAKREEPSVHVPPITYPRAPIADLRGPELVLVISAPDIDPVTLKPQSLGQTTNTKEAYQKLPIAVKLRILRSILEEKSLMGRGIYKWITDTLTHHMKAKWDAANTPLNEREKDIADVLRQEISQLERQVCPERDIDGIHRKLIDAIYTDYLKKPVGTDLPEESLNKAQLLMNRRMPHKETLVEHFRVLCRIRGLALPEFTSSPAAFTDYWLNCTYSTNPTDQEHLSMLIEAMASWVDTDGRKLDASYQPSTRAAPQSWTLRALERTTSFIDRNIPLVSTWGATQRMNPRQGPGLIDQALDFLGNSIERVAFSRPVLYAAGAAAIATTAAAIMTTPAASKSLITYGAGTGINGISPWDSARCVSQAATGILATRVIGEALTKPALAVVDAVANTTNTVVRKTKKTRQFVADVASTLTGAVTTVATTAFSGARWMLKHGKAAKSAYQAYQKSIEDPNSVGKKPPLQ